MSDRAGERPLALADPVLFDLDGTLVASGPGILASVRHALNALGEPIPSDKALARFVGPPLQDSFRVECGLDEARAWQAVLAYRERYTSIGQFESSVYDGIPEVLAALQDAGRRLVVATSKPEPYARTILAHHGLADAFIEVVGSELDGRRTAKAEVIAEALSRLGQRADSGPGTPVMIGDRSHDVLGAQALGVPAVGVLWGHGTADELREAGATLLAEHPADLLAALDA